MELSFVSYMSRSLVSFYDSNVSITVDTSTLDMKEFSAKVRSTKLRINFKSFIWYFYSKQHSSILTITLWDIK